MKSSFLLLAFILFTACGSSTQTGKAKRAAKPVVPLAFIINTGKNHELNFINMDYYRLKILDQLDNFQNVEFTLVEPDENPEVTLNLNIDNFVLWPRNQKVSRRVFSRTVQTGTDASGKPVYQVVRASVDLVQVQRRSNARFLVDLRIKGDPGKTYKQSFAPNYNYNITYADNIQGDSRAIDPSLYFARGPGVEPEAVDFLLTLSEEMLDRVSREFRSYYRK
jgi:hypothetical protein